jgi:hypothetical protein
MDRIDRIKGEFKNLKFQISDRQLSFLRPVCLYPVYPVHPVKFAFGTDSSWPEKQKRGGSRIKTL